MPKPYCGAAHRQKHSLVNASSVSPPTDRKLAVLIDGDNAQVSFVVVTRFPSFQLNLETLRRETCQCGHTAAVLDFLGFPYGRQNAGSVLFQHIHFIFHNCSDLFTKPFVLPIWNGLINRLPH